MDKAIRVLIVEDVEDDALLLLRHLTKGGYRPEHKRVDTSEHLRQALAEESWDIVISDYNMPSFNGLEALLLTKEHNPDLPFIIASGAIGEEKSVALIKSGATDYVMKDRLERLGMAVERALREAQDQQRLRQGQNQLRLSEEKFRRLFETAGDAIFFCDLEGRLIETNKIACEEWGGPREELLAMNVQAFIGPGYNLPLLHWDVSPQKSQVFESVYIRKNGSSFPIEINRCQMDYQGLPALLFIVRNITERKIAEDDLQSALTQAQDARDKIDAILRSVADGLVVIDSEGVIILMNQAAERLLNITADTIVGEILESSMPLPELNKVIAATLAGNGDNLQIEWESLAPDAHVARFVQARTSLVRNRNGMKSGVIAILRDITRERELDRMKSDFITIAAHEMSTPLAAIMGFAELLLEKSDMPQELQRESLQYIVEKTEALEEITDKLLNLSRVEFGLHHRMEVKPTAMEETIRQVVNQFRCRFHDHNFELSLPQTTTILECDQRRITQVVENILDNAVKFSPKKYSVAVSAEDDGECYQVRIADEGRGMNPQQSAKIFDKFYRADTSDTAVGGLGLGMCVAKSIVAAHKGQIWVESEPGKGTTVTFSLPKEPPGQE